MKKMYWILWPSFLVAGCVETLFFLFIDPRELYFLGEPVQFSSMATYSIGFFCFWAICAASSLATCFFQRAAAELNRSTAPDRSGAPRCSG